MLPVGGASQPTTALPPACAKPGRLGKLARTAYLALCLFDGGTARIAFCDLNSEGQLPAKRAAARTLTNRRS